MSALLSFPFTTQSYENVKLEPMDVSTLKKAVTKATVKNILLTPESSYDPRQAHMMLHKVPLSIVGVSVKELVSEGLIAKARGGKDRRVPGRQFQLSDKSLATLTGCLADRLIPQSVAFSAHLAEQWDAEGKCDVSPLISSGGMACLLDQAASGILKLKAEELPEESPEFSKKAYCVPVSLVPCPEVMHAKESSKRHVTKSNEPSKKRSRDDSIENQPQTVEKEMSAIEKRALERIRESGLLGIAIQDLTNELENCGSSLQEVQERLATLSNRTDQDGHPLISAVGFTEYRYVSHEHAPEWSVKLVSKLQELSDLPHNPVCPARLWFDINGTSVPSVIRACMEALISHIHMRPGIREYILWQQVKTLLSPVEVSDLLDMMVARGAIRVQKVEKSKPLKSALAFFSPGELVYFL